MLLATTNISVKKCISHLLAIISICLILLTACHKDSGGGGQRNIGDNPDSIRNVITHSLIDSLRKWGMNIYDGKTPPIVAGIYDMDPDSCIFDNWQPKDNLGNRQGVIIPSYIYQFTKQDNTRMTIRFDRKLDQGGGDAASNTLG